MLTFSVMTQQKVWLGLLVTAALVLFVWGVWSKPVNAQANGAFAFNVERVVYFEAGVGFGAANL